MTSNEGPTAEPTLSRALSRAETKASKIQILRKACPALSSTAIDFLSSIQTLEGDWAERATRALGSARVGSPERAARTLAASASQSPRVLRQTGTIEAVVELGGASDWMSRLLSSRPELAAQLCGGCVAAASGRAPKSAAENYRTEMSKLVEETAGDTAAFEAQIRDLRTRESLRIALRELRGADLRSTAAELSDFASSALYGSLAHHLPLLVDAYGPLEPPCRHLVVGLGKLGGRELNFSSDIDVLYLYEHDEGSAGPLSNHHFHVRLFEKVTNTLSRVTERGRVFRVDIDLRPEGRTGALCNSLASLERYYETWGRTWERAVWIKARPVAGDVEMFEDVQTFIRPFVYRRSRDLSAVEGVLSMKAKIDAQSGKAPVGKRGFNLKLGRGGIREIEFFAQGQQLLYGGRDPRLRPEGTLDALHALEVAGRLNARDRQVLSDAYVFLRRVEHRVQLVEDRQTHVLPSSSEAMGSLARSLGFERSDGLEAAIRHHTNGVHRLFSGLLGSVEEEPPTPPEVGQLLNSEASPENQQSILEALGSRAPQTALASLKAAARIPRSPFHPAASERLASIGRQFLAECLASPDLDRALLHLPALLRALMYHGAYLEQLTRSDLRRGVARVLGASDLLARILVSSPWLLPSVLFEGDRPSPDAFSELHSELDLSDIEATMVRLRLAKQELILRLATAELAGALDAQEVELRLTRLAERLIDVTLEISIAEATARYGAPNDPNAALTILGGGTLGAQELGYRSDVDLSALFVGSGETQGRLKGPVSLSEFYTRVIQRMLSLLTVRTPQGDLYPVDMRLRPSGSQGTLVTSLENFENYHQRGRAQLWERQALVRTRVVAGAESLRGPAKEALHRATYGRVLSPEAVTDIHAMRVRLEKERARRREDSAFHIKHGKGGLVEVEFLVQYLLLKHVPEDPGLATTSTQGALLRLGEGGYIPSAVARQLASAQVRFRRILNWVRVIHDDMLDVVHFDPRSLRPVALALRYEGGDAQDRLREDIEMDRRTIREAYENYVNPKA